MKPADDGLRAENLTVRYGGLTAVDDLSFEVPVAHGTGLIGPNGAGKTSVFNACSGLVRLAAGRLELFGEDITGMRPQGRARRGLGRTFQRVELCDDLTVGENVALAREARAAGHSVRGHIGTSRRERLAAMRACDEAIELCGLGEHVSKPAGLLPTGDRRLVELARVVAAEYRLLLLDEPSSGLDTAETARFGEILRQLVRERGVGLLLVEHDISLVRAVCTEVYVLDFGRLLTHGPTAQTLDGEIVRNAYLGAREVDRV